MLIVVFYTRMSVSLMVLLNIYIVRIWCGSRIRKMIAKSLICRVIKISLTLTDNFPLKKRKKMEKKKKQILKLTNTPA